MRVLIKDEYKFYKDYDIKKDFIKFVVVIINYYDYFYYLVLFEV